MACAKSKSCRSASRTTARSDVRLQTRRRARTVKLLKDITLDKTLSIDGKSFTLDLNGRTISGSVATTQVNKINTSGLLCVGSGSTVTITDLSEGEQKGSITNTGTTTSRAVAVRTGASVTLENGVNLNAEGGSNCSALYIYTNDANAPQALVRNANLTSDAKGYPIRFDSTARAAKLTIEGGTFHRGRRVAQPPAHFQRFRKQHDD